jgi:FkbM family methyltransferase
VQQLLVRRLPSRWVYALAEARHGRQEPELRRLDDYVPEGRAAVDVGAWLGPWTRALSRRASHVHAFEPQPRLAAHLAKVVAANVTVHEAAVGAEAGSALLAVDDGPGRDALAHLVPEPSAAALTVRQVRLDDLDLDDVGFVKIDVEGHELGVLQGAEALLRRCRPSLLVEVEQRHLPGPITEVFDWTAGRGWTGWFLRAGTWRPLATFDLERDQLQWVERLPTPAYVNNFLFLPTSVPPSSR